MTNTRRRKTALARAAAAARRKGIDPDVSPELFDAEVQWQMEKWERKNEGNVNDEEDET